MNENRLLVLTLSLFTLIRTVDAKIAVNFSKTLVIQSVQLQHFRN